jgi:membrane protease YdiL (CAAX protease family)
VPTEVTSPARARVSAISFAVGIAAVPALAHGPSLLVLCCVALAAAGTRSASRAAILGAYAAPVLVAAPWPVHCATACAAWAFSIRRSERDVRPVRPTVAFPRTPLAVAGLVALGGIAGGTVVFLDRVRIVQNGFVFPVGRPAPPVLVLVVVVLALANALAEELLWREMLDTTLSDRSRRGRYVVQILTFGVGHWNGIPHAVVGVVASGAFSAVVYRVRERFGLLGAVLVHTVTDLVIFAAVARYAVYSWTGFSWTTLP